jgi:hypothetical protein
MWEGLFAPQHVFALLFIFAGFSVLSFLAYHGGRARGYRQGLERGGNRP